MLQRVCERVTIGFAFIRWWSKTSRIGDCDRDDIVSDLDMQPLPDVLVTACLVSLCMAQVGGTDGGGALGPVDGHRMILKRECQYWFVVRRALGKLA